MSLINNRPYNGGLDESQAGIKIARRNINNLRYSDNTTVMAESEEELKSLLMRMKEDNEKASLFYLFIYFLIYLFSIYFY